MIVPADGHELKPLVWIFYFVGQGLHVLLVSWLASRSDANTLSGPFAYVKLRWVPILCRVFLVTLSFMFIWLPVIGALSGVIKAYMQLVALAGVFGWCSDSVWDKFIALLAPVVPALQKEQLPKLEDK